MSNCPDRDRLAAYLAGALPAADRPALDGHLEVCPACGRILATLAGGAGLSDLLGPPAPPLPPFLRALAARPPERPPATAVHFPGPPTGRGPLGQLGSYHVVRLLGRGAFGAVYEAHDDSLGQTVALKVLRPERAEDAQERARFEREGRQIAAVRHPNVVAVYSVGQTPGFPPPYLVMEYVGGGSLDARLRAAGRLDPRAAAALVAGAARGVAAAHDQGIVHRDLKPANVLLDAAGEPKVADFGLARRHADVSTIQVLAGTPAYMAPEQARFARFVGPPADVWALGVILYECLTGERPFDGGSTAEILHGVTSKEPARVRARVPNVPRDLETIVGECLVKEPEGRYRTAGELADDLDRFGRGEPILARPAGVAERGYKWARRNPGRAGAMAAAVLVLVGAAVAALAVRDQRLADQLAAADLRADDRIAAEGKRLADLRAADEKRAADLKAADDEAKQKQRKTKADALVDALASADTAGVLRLIEDLKEYRDLTGAKLRELTAQPVGTKPGLHARLALSVDEPARAGEVAAYLPACKPDELLPAVRLLKTHAGAVAPGLWAVLTDAKADAGKRVRAAGALAGLTPADPRWASVAASLAEAVVRANPVEFVAWSAALEPVGGALVPALLARYPAARGRIESGKLAVSELAREVSGYDLTANLLARYAVDRPADLAELALIADPRHYPLFARAIGTNKAGVVPVLKAELAKSVVADWKDAPLKSEWAAADPATVKSVAAAGGLVHERFALVQSLPLAGFEPLASALGRSGYRPVRVRPYVTDAGVKVAAVWRRDGVAWRLLAGATANDVGATDDELRAAGFQPADVAGWVDPDAKPRRVAPFVAAFGGAGGFAAASAPALRFAAVWEAAPGEKPVNRLYVACEGTAGHWAGFAPYQKAKLWPRTVQAVGVPGVGTWFSGVWGDAPEGSDLNWHTTPAEYLTGEPNKAAVDVTFYPDGQGVPTYAAVRHGGLTVEVERPTRVSVAEQMKKAQELAAAGWRPVALGVSGSEMTASIWHRPVTDAALEVHGKRRGHAAAALLTLGEGEAAWPVFAFPAGGDPTARSYLQERLAAVGADPAALVRRFGGEGDVSAKRALVIALGDFPAELVPVGEREPFVSRLLALYRDDPDSGLHGAIDWLLRQKWGKGKELAAIDAELARAARGRVAALAGAVPPGPLGAAIGPQLPAPRVAAGTDWFVNGEGQTYAVVRGPVEFTLGSPETEPGRLAVNEPAHRKRIGRSFAIGAKEVTVAEFLRFWPEHSWVKRYSPDQDSPAVSMTWYEAAGYCNWLSGREGIPSDQWCYAPNKDGGYDEGMRMKAGHLGLTGYRLPTEAEWEYACRSGGVTARYFGRGEGLLPRYGWFDKNAEGRAWPVGQLRPNDRGLFDTLGNAMEWVEDPGMGYVTGEREDTENSKYISIDERISRLLRGGSFYVRPVNLRSANRLSDRPGLRFNAIGFRPVRTLP